MRTGQRVGNRSRESATPVGARTGNLIVCREFRTTRTLDLLRTRQTAAGHVLLGSPPWPGRERPLAEVEPYSTSTFEVARSAFDLRPCSACVATNDSSRRIASSEGEPGSTQYRNKY